MSVSHYLTLWMARSPTLLIQLLTIPWILRPPTAVKRIIFWMSLELTRYALAQREEWVPLESGVNQPQSVLVSEWYLVYSLYSSFSHFVQLRVLSYPHWPRGWSCTVKMREPLVLMLRTPATIATLSMEVAPGLVPLGGVGVGQLQLVNVSVVSLSLHVSLPQLAMTWHVANLKLMHWSSSSHHLPWPVVTNQWNDQLQ